MQDGEQVVVRLQPVLEEIATCLAARGVALPEVASGNRSHRIRLAEIPDGAYYEFKPR